MERREGHLLMLAGFLTFSFFLLSINRRLHQDHLVPPRPKIYHHHGPPGGQETARLIPKGPCTGARGTSLDDPLSQDIAHPMFNVTNTPYPIPTYGSYVALHLDQSWMTFTQRYGPYGDEGDSVGYNLTGVRWETQDWGKLQDQCLLDHSDLDSENELFQAGALPRFRLQDDEQPQQPRGRSTGRQAIVIRTWSTYDYKPEDYFNLRSIITEAGLASKGKYTVFLLVDVKGVNASRIHENDDCYQEVMTDCVPPEFRSMAVLFHQSLLESWYPRVGKFNPNVQIMQPFQLFAHFYTEFDHFWQFEMDNRFTGNIGEMLQKFHIFGSIQPYKQARERASWTYMPKVHGTYEEFAAKINATLKGNATVWGAVNITQIDPIGTSPPCNSTDDNFEWGVSQDADLLLFSILYQVSRFQTDQDWVFRAWRGGFNGDNPPRFQAAPAQGRASRRLLQSIHTAQHEQGLWVPSEATLPSFALWNGLKVVHLPHPNFQWPERDLDELNIMHNGGRIAEFKDGIANGAAPYRKSVIEFYSRPRTFEWQSSLIDPSFDHWINKKDEEGTPKTKRASAATMGHVPDELPGFMAEIDGEVYMPSLLLHPRKTNRNI